ncbi:MAG: Ribonuclease 3 [Proteobacteria bacterium]|jgi:ribonuclease-3|nr:MAG: Ribonuclease 3 [Pseudomonadota bacterium]
MNIDFSNLENHLNHNIQDYGLFEHALTHSSVGKTNAKGIKHNNERLEFLGDRVLNFTIADLLYKQFPDKPEGFLSKMHSALVSQTTLAEIAKQIGLDEVIQLGKGEAMSGGAQKPTILSDAMESILAAYYLDSSFEDAQNFIIKYWTPWIERVEIKDPKSRLQEILQQNGLALPDYEVIDERGPAHERIFVIKVSSSDGRFAIDEGLSKQEAQQNAARKLVTILENKFKFKNK